MLYDKHVLRDHRDADSYDRDFEAIVSELKPTFLDQDYIQIFGLLQWMLRHRKKPYGLAETVNSALEECRAAYRVVDRDTIVPFASEAELATLRQGFADLESVEFNGAKAHLRSAGEELSVGRFAASIRESIHAVESVARVLEPTGDFSKAIARLEASANIHGAMKKAFTALYGYSSNAQGIRHPLLDEGKPNVDEADALFMIGACAAFVSYMINKGRDAGLLNV